VGGGRPQPHPKDAIGEQVLGHLDELLCVVRIHDKGASFAGLMHEQR
jgi:hypothetical protein